MSRPRALVMATAIVGMIVGSVTVGVHVGLLPWATAKDLDAHRRDDVTERAMLVRSMRDVSRDVKRLHELLLLHHADTERRGR